MPSATAYDRMPALSLSPGQDRLDPLPPTPLFAMAALVHGAFSSPTPDQVGWPECVVGGLLALAVWAGVTTGPRTHFRFEAPVSARWQTILIANGMGLGLLPFVVGVLRGCGSVDIIRDLIPLGFLTIPILCWGRIDTRVLLPCVALAGGLMAARQIGLQGNPMQWGRQAEDLLYLSNSPLVLFAAIYGLASGLRSVIVRPTGLGIVLLLAGTAGWIALALTLQRGAVVLGGLSVGLCILALWRDHPARMGLILTLAALLTLNAAPHFGSEWLRGLVEKTATVGTNSRTAELAIAWQVASRDPLTLLFGLGWGGLIELPSTPGMAVSFLHALPTYLLVKTGLVGVGVAIAGVVPFLATLCRGQRSPIILFALVATLTVHTLVLPGFKSLGAALLLLALTPSRHQTD